MSAAKTKNLLQISAQMRESLQIFKEINQRSGIIAMNASIEGARLRESLASFSIVAKQIHLQSLKNAELSEKLDKLVAKLQSVSLRSTAVRYYELAEDLVDKLDRNLFERNCDVQAWATFDEIVRCASAGLEMTPDQMKEADQADPIFTTASGLLNKLVTIYCVYADVFLVNSAGVVVTSAKNKNLVGTNVKEETWFENGLAGNVDVSDMQYCAATRNYAVYYTAPVKNAENKVIGVLSSRFNWDFAQEMIEHAGYDSNVRAHYINVKSDVIASTGRLGTMSDTMNWLDAGLSTVIGECGYSVERARNGNPIAVGFARTKGYNSYRGKKWSSLITCRLADNAFEHIHQPLDLRTEEKPAGNKLLSEDRRIESEKANQELQTTMKEIHQLVTEVNRNNKEAKLLAINASIQAGIAGSEGESFTIIAEEIGRLAQKSLGFVESVNETAKELQVAVETTVSNRLVDAARDTIDKVDRNLFERYCDVQAWTAFQQIITALETNQVGESIQQLLAKLHKIYEVYHDVFLLNKEGTIMSAAINQRLVGENQRTRDWFQQAVQGRVNFTDVYRSASIQNATVAFSAPVYGSDGTVIGVISTRFNCNFLNDILRVAIVDSLSQVFLVNKSGLLVSSADGGGVLEKNMADLEAFKLNKQNKFGNTLETEAKSKEHCSYGYAATVGYNTYPGNNWTILVRRPLQQEQPVVAADATAEAKKTKQAA